jgi:hypothetical protein
VEKEATEETVLKKQERKDIANFETTVKELQNPAIRRLAR